MSFPECSDPVIEHGVEALYHEDYSPCDYTQPRHEPPQRAIVDTAPPPEPPRDAFVITGFRHQASHIEPVLCRYDLLPDGAVYLLRQFEWARKPPKCDIPF